MSQVKYIEGSELADILLGNPTAVLSKDVVIVDVRGDGEFSEGHICGATNRPSTLWSESSFVDSLAEQLLADQAEGNARKKIVMHCAYSQQRGPTCAKILQTKMEQLQSSGELHSESIPEM
jgi:rhodanese-related sulfurtransferase